MADDGRLTAELAAIKERAAKASPGPWKFEREHLYDMDDEPFTLDSVLDADGQVVLETLADLRFAAHAREDIPRLVKALEGVLKAAAGWQRFAADGDAQAECAREVRKIITSELAGKAADGG